MTTNQQPEISAEVKLRNLIASAKEALAALKDENEGVYKNRVRTVAAYAINLMNEAENM